MFGGQLENGFSEENAQGLKSFKNISILSTYYQYKIKVSIIAYPYSYRAFHGKKYLFSISMCLNATPNWLRYD